MKVAIVTGCSTGIGVEIVRGLAEDDKYGRIICAVRNPAKMMTVMGQAGYSHKVIEKCEIVELNLASLDSVDQFLGRLKVLKITRIDRLVLNAGTKDYSSDKRTTIDGIDEIWQINYFSNFYLVCALIPVLKASPGSRVVILSSLMHWFGSSEAILNLTSQGTAPDGARLWSAYRDSKLAITVLGSELCRRGIDAVAVNPGAVASDIWRRWYEIYLIGPIIRLFVLLLFLSCKDGSQTTLYACRELDENRDGKLVYLSPYGQIKSRWTITALLSDIHWFWIAQDRSRFIGQCVEFVNNSVIGERVWEKSIGVITSRSTYKSRLYDRMM